MSRVADYTILGFLYQFNKTLLEILSSSDDSQITVEGIIEDIDIVDHAGIKAIQCKYHELQQDFVLSLVYKPILQMMDHFRRHADLHVDYKLYAYFPNKVGIYPITIEDLTNIIASTNKDLQTYINALRGSINLATFLSRFSFEFGELFDGLILEVQNALLAAGLAKDDVDTIIYPNALQIIVNLSCKHTETERITTKPDLLTKLKEIRTTAISRWTLALASYNKILDARKKQLKPNLNKNSRLRYFVLSQRTLEDFSENIVNFVQDYLDMYHFKPTHNQPPVFCLDCTYEVFDDIRERIHKKGIRLTDGFVGSSFDKALFFREPMTLFAKHGSEFKTEFRIRLLKFDSADLILNERKCDDLFIVSENDYEELVLKDINVEKLAVTRLQQLKFLLDLSDSYE